MFRKKTVTSLQSPHINTTKLLRDQGEQDVFSMNVLPENMQQLFHMTEPKWTKVPVEQLAEFMSPIFHIKCIFYACIFSICQSIFHIVRRVLLGAQPTQACLTETKTSSHNRKKEKRQDRKTKSEGTMLQLVFLMLSEQLSLDNLFLPN